MAKSHTIFGIVFSDNGSLNQLSYLPIYLPVNFVFQPPLSPPHPKDSRVLACRCPGPDASMPGLAWGARMTVISLRLATALSHTGLSPQALTYLLNQYTDVPFLVMGTLFSDSPDRGFLDHSISPYILVTAQVRDRRDNNSTLPRA